MISLAEFRQDPERVAGLRKALENPHLIEAISILARKGPGMIRSDISPTYSSLLLGQSAGWAMYPDTLEVMATHLDRDTNVDNPRLREDLEKDEETE